jgi:hypothetical protein
MIPKLETPSRARGILFVNFDAWTLQPDLEIDRAHEQVRQRWRVGFYQDEPPTVVDVGRFLDDSAVLGDAVAELLDEAYLRENTLLINIWLFNLWPPRNAPFLDYRGGRLWEFHETGAMK